MTATDIVSNGVAVAGFTNVVINIVRMSFPRAPGVPLIALSVSIGIAFLLATANGIGFDRPAIAFTVLVGISAAGGAMLIAMAQTKGDEKHEEAKIEDVIAAKKKEG